MAYRKKLADKSVFAIFAYKSSFWIKIIKMIVENEAAENHEEVNETPETEVKTPAQETQAENPDEEGATEENEIMPEPHETDVLAVEETLKVEDIPAEVTIVEETSVENLQIEKSETEELKTEEPILTNLPETPEPPLDEPPVENQPIEEPAIENEPVIEQPNLDEPNTAVEPVEEPVQTEIPVLTAVQENVAVAEKENADPETIETHEELPDFANFDKKDLIAFAENLLKETDIKKIDQSLKPLRIAFDEIKENEKTVSLEKFLSEGGEADGFEFKPDEETNTFERVYRQVKDKKNKHFQDQEKQKEQNFKRKQELLEILRALADSEDSQDNFQKFKQLQQEWKSIGTLPAGTSKELWASYEILIDRYFNNRNIQLELKELDRKKNAKLKTEVIEKAEKLVPPEAT
ncbi:MAG: DUF349 domain-containing protein [Verrucomicrobia bacterium]|nr:DUF349 domain-containing protein [Cytophagales bacterium]